MQHPSLPVELWLQILRLLRPPVGEHVSRRSGCIENLQSVSLTCKMLCDLVRPLLFQRLELSVSRDLDDAVLLFHRTNNIRRMLDARPDSNHWIKEFIFKDTNSVHEDDEDVPLRDEQTIAAEELLYQLRHLEVLHLEVKRFTTEMFVYFWRLPSLHSLTLHLRDDCSYSPSEYITPDLKSAPLPITTMHLTAYHKERLCQALLSHLIAKSSLTTLEANFALLPIILARDPGNTAPFRELRELEVYILDVRHVYEIPSILALCPNLVSLTVVESVEDQTLDWASIAIPQTTSTLLEHLAGPLALAEVLTSGRPVTCLEITDLLPELSGVDFQPLSRGSTPVKVLKLGAVSGKLQTFRSVAKAFPRLEELSVRFVWGNSPLASLEDLCRDGTVTFSHLKKLCTYGYDSFAEEVGLCARDPTDMVRHVEILGAADRTFPVLRCAEIQDMEYLHDMNRKTWIMTKEFDPRWSLWNGH